MKHIRSRKKLVQTALRSGQVMTCSLAVGAAAHADSRMTETAPTQTLDTIVVKRQPAQQGYKVNKSTNAKYVAPLLDTPKSVSVIPPQLIRDTQTSTLTDALRTVPGITLGAGEGGNPMNDRPFIRGFHAESSVYVDGIRQIGSQNREMFTVEQVEVTKGSSSVLGGAGNGGGVVLLSSRLPKARDHVQASLQNGTDQYRRIELDLNKTLADGVAGRVVLMGHQNDKPGAIQGATYQRYGLAPSVTFGMGSPRRATLSYYYVHTDDIPDSGIPYNNPFAATSPHARLNGDGQPIDVQQGIYYGWKDRDFQRQDNHIGTLSLQQDFDNGLSLTHNTSLARSSNDYLWTQPDNSQGNFYDKTTGALNGTIFRRSNSRQTQTDSVSSQLFLTGQLQTGQVKHRFNTGIEYSHAKVDRQQYLNDTDQTATGAFASACPASAIQSGWCTSVLSPRQVPWRGQLSTAGSDRYEISSQQTGLYVLNTLELDPQWLLDLGVRWDKFDTRSTLTYGPYNSAVIAAKPTQQASDVLNVSNDANMTTYQAGVTFKPRPNGSIYLSYATSANPVGVDFGDGSEGISAANADLAPEQLRTLELGTKWDILNNRLNLTAALFRTEKTNTRVLDSGGLTRNIGATQTDGIEVTASGKLNPRWDLSAGYTYLDGKQLEAGMINLGTTQQPRYAPSPATGKQIPQLARHSASLWSTYQVLPVLTVGGGAFYSDKVFGNTVNTKWVPGYVRYDAMARYAVNKNIDVQVNVNNLTNQRYFTKAYASHYAVEADGRQGLISLNLKY